MINSLLIVCLQSYIDLRWSILKQLKVLIGLSGVGVELQVTFVLWGREFGDLDRI